MPRDKLRARATYPHCTVSGNCRPNHFELEVDSHREDAQYELMLTKSSDNSSVRFVAEGDSHCLYEVRLHRIGQSAEASLSAFEGEETGTGEAGAA